MSFVTEVLLICYIDIAINYNVIYNFSQHFPLLSLFACIWTFWKMQCWIVGEICLIAHFLSHFLSTPFCVKFGLHLNTLSTLVLTYYRPRTHVVRGKVMFWHVSRPHLGGGVPQPGPDTVVTPARSRWGYPPIGPGWGVPCWGYPCWGSTPPQVSPHQTWLGGLPCQCGTLLGGTPPKVPPVRPGQGGTLPGRYPNSINSYNERIRVITTCNSLPLAIESLVVNNEAVFIHLIVLAAYVTGSHLNMVVDLHTSLLIV